jgi:hypothetical protein
MPRARVLLHRFVIRVQALQETEEIATNPWIQRSDVGITRFAVVPRIGFVSLERSRYDAAERRGRAARFIERAADALEVSLRLGTLKTAPRFDRTPAITGGPGYGPRHTPMSIF